MFQLKSMCYDIIIFDDHWYDECMMCDSDACLDGIFAETSFFFRREQMDGQQPDEKTHLQSNTTAH